MAKVEVLMDEKAHAARNQLNYKLIKFSWAIFFILVGGSWILENIGAVDNTEKWAVIYAGSGVILLSLNLLRTTWKLKTSRFSTGLGVLGLLLGAGKFLDIGGISIWATVVLIIGFFMLFDVLGNK